jgi:uncharacterized membrane protein
MTEVKMSNPQVSTVPSVSQMALRTTIVSLAIFAAIMLVVGPRSIAWMAGALVNSRIHAPRLDLIARSPAVIQIHLVTVLAAFAVATMQILAPKGTTLHRITGWTLVTLFLATAIDSFFIRAPGAGPFNPFQIFSVWTLIGIPLAVISVKRGNVAVHARMMTGFYVGSLVIAGALTFMPGRLMWQVFFG